MAIFQHPHLQHSETSWNLQRLELPKRPPGILTISSPWEVRKEIIDSEVPAGGGRGYVWKPDHLPSHQFSGACLAVFLSGSTRTVLPSPPKNPPEIVWNSSLNFGGKTPTISPKDPSWSFQNMAELFVGSLGVAGTARRPPCILWAVRSRRNFPRCQRQGGKGVGG